MYLVFFFTIFNNKSNYQYKFEHNFNVITYRGIDQREIRKHEIVLISSIL